MTWLRLPPALLLVLSACGAGGAETNVVETEVGTIDGQPAPPKSTPDRLTAIPDQFRGDWSVAGTDCGALSGGVLAVGGTELRSRETTSTPTYTLREDSRAIALELTVTGEGESWTETTTLRLILEDRLSRRDPNGREVLYSRCRAR